MFFMVAEWPLFIQTLCLVEQSRGEAYSLEWTLLVRRMAAWRPRLRVLRLASV